MNLLFDNRLGAEDLQLAAFKTISQYISDFITEEQDRAAALDLQIADAGGNDLSVTLESFQQGNIHYGHRPSMIEAPVEEYPSMSVQVYSSSPAGANQSADYGNSITLRCAIEFIVKSGPYDPEDRAGDGEDIVSRRAARTAEAVHRLMQEHGALDGQFMPPESAPVVTFGEIFARDEDGITATGARWYWKGVRMDYTYLKMSVFGTNDYS